MVVREVLLFTSEFPNHAGLFMRAMDWTDDLRDVIHSHREEHESLFRNVIAEGVRAGAFHVPNEVVARFCVQGSLVYISEWYHPEGDIAPTELGEMVADTVLQTLGATISSSRARRIASKSN
jgi:hypothetical protein